MGSKKYCLLCFEEHLELYKGWDKISDSTKIRSCLQCMRKLLEVRAVEHHLAVLHYYCFISSNLLGSTAALSSSFEVAGKGVYPIAFPSLEPLTIPTFALCTAAPLHDCGTFLQPPLHPSWCLCQPTLFTYSASTFLHISQIHPIQRSQDQSWATITSTASLLLVTRGEFGPGEKSRARTSQQHPQVPAPPHGCRTQDLGCKYPTWTGTLHPAALPPGEHQTKPLETAFFL